MDLTAVELPATWLAAGWAATLPALAWAVLRAPRRRLQDGTQIHVWCGAIFCTVVVWSIQATVGEGFTFHLLGAAAFTLVAGPALALLGSAVAVALIITVRGGLWANAGVAFVTMAALPIAMAWAIHVLAQRRLPPNFFIYIFVGAFFGGGAALAVGGTAGATVLAFGGGVSPALVFGEYLPYLLYLAFGEATLTGMVLTLLVVYRPGWVASFDDRHYLTRR